MSKTIEDYVKEIAELKAEVKRLNACDCHKVQDCIYYKELKEQACVDAVMSDHYKKKDVEIAELKEQLAQATEEIKKGMKQFLRAENLQKRLYIQQEEIIEAMVFYEKEMVKARQGQKDESHDLTIHDEDAYEQKQGDK